jgi:pimeloyl-ACP methyl ester carboxylesterase
MSCKSAASNRLEHFMMRACAVTGSARSRKQSIHIRILPALVFFAACSLVGADEVFHEARGLTLNGNLVLVEGDAAPKQMVLITHSLIQHNAREPIPYLQELLRDRGYSSLAINYSLNVDNRHGPFDCLAPHRYTLEDSLAEIGIWLDWLKRRGVQRLVLMGHSYGGNEIARYAANHDEEAIAAVVLLGPGTADHRMWSPAGYKIRYGKELKGVIEHAEMLVASGAGETLMQDVDFIFCPKATVSAASFASYYRVDPERLLPNLLRAAKKPTLFIAASEDNRLPDLNRLVTPYIDGDRTRMVVIEGAGHFFLDLHSDDAVDEMVEFFAEVGF